MFFRAGHAPGSGFRRNVSVGPGLALEHEDEDHSERSSYMQHDESRDGSRGRSPPPRDAATVRRPRRRHMSVDQTHYQRSFVSHHDNGYHPPVASPPYTPTYSQEDTVLVSPTASIINRSSLPMYDESPARSLEDLRRALEAEQYYTGGRDSFELGIVADIAARSQVCLALHPGRDARHPECGLRERFRTLGVSASTMIANSRSGAARRIFNTQGHRTR